MQETGWTFESSYYEASVTRPDAAPPLTGSATADVCVIGAGFTGVSCALNLAQRGRRVILLESRAVGWGASGRNGGQMLHDFSSHNLPAVARAAKVSEKTLFDMSLAAVELIHTNARQYNIDCDIRRGYAEAAVKQSHLRELQQWAEKAAREYDYPHNTVLDSVRFREIIASRAYCGGLLNDISGHLHPLKYLLGLAAAAVAAGVRLHENTAATRIEETAAGSVTVHTREGSVQAASVFVACNAYLDNLLPAVQPRIMPVGTYIAATEPLGAEADNLIADNRCVCNTNFVIDYYRASADKRLLFGGRVSYSRRPPSDLSNALRRRMLTIFPQLSEVRYDYVWGGYVAITINRFPDIGRVGKSVYYAQGFSGHGVALTGYTGKLIADAICGEQEKFSIFSRVPHRKFPGGDTLRTPLLVLAMLYYRLRDIL